MKRQYLVMKPIFTGIKKSRLLTEAAFVWAKDRLFKNNGVFKKVLILIAERNFMPSLH